MEESVVYTLLIESSTKVASVAVLADDQLLGHTDIHHQKSHARLTAPMIQQLLENLQLSPKDLSAMAVSKGPGSYTGLRVGVSTAKGLAMATAIPLIGISSLQLLAAQVQALAKQSSAWICPMIDARRMEVYSALYDAQLAEQMDIQPIILTESWDIEAILDQRKVIFLGDGAAKAEAILGTHPNAIFWTQGLATAAYGGKLVYQAYTEKRFEDLVTFEPFYLKSYRATTPKNPLRGKRD